MHRSHRSFTLGMVLRRSVVGFVVHRCSLWRNGATTVIHSVGYSPTAYALHHRRLAC